MANEWNAVTVGDIFDLVNGYAFKSADFINSGVPVIKIKNVKAGEFSEHDFSYVTEDFLRTRANKLAKFGDLLISMSGNRHDGSPETWVGKVAQFRKTGSYFINQRVGALRVKEGARVDSRFASYVLSSFPYQELFIAIATSSGGQANLSPAQILSAPMRYPSLHEQRAIAHILGTLDDKIELNRKQNETLEAMTHTLFKAWFVDFEPVRAKMEGRWQRGQSQPGLPAHLYDLFPDRLVESELGEIPDGWKYAPLRELASTISKGTTPTKDALNNASDTNVTYFLKVRDITESGEIARNSLELIPISIHENALKRSILRTEDLLFCIAGTIGRVAIVDEDLNNSNCNQAIAFIRLKDKKNFQSLCWFTLRSKRTQDFVESKIVQGVQANASLATIGEIPVLVPNDGVLPAWNEFVRPLMQELKANQSQSRIVTRLRDALLPKLISGELRVPDAEAFLRERGL